MEGSNKHYNTLLLFTKQNYLIYKNNKENYIDLNSKMLHKLKILTLLDLVKDKKNVKFDELFRVLEITDPFEFDSIVFEAISLGLISGKVDQKNKILKILSVKGRDFIYDTKEVEAKLDRWIDNLEQSTKYIDKEVEGLRLECRCFNDHLNDHINNLNSISEKYNQDKEKLLISPNPK